jgi:hypothetical protein
MNVNQPDPPVAPKVHDEAHGLARDDFRPLRVVFCVLVALQFVTALAYSRVYVTLIRTGEVELLSSVGVVLGSACLYGATTFVALGRARGFIAFAMAAGLLGSSFGVWSLGYPWRWVVAFGAVLAVLGALLVRVIKSRDERFCQRRDNRSVNANAQARPAALPHLPWSPVNSGVRRVILR